MNYLSDYLRIIPEYDAIQIQQAIEQNKLSFGLDEISEDEFRELVHYISEENIQLTHVPVLGDTIQADPLNRFYSAVAIDLSKLFQEQAAIETASENYHHIYKSALEDIAREVDGLETSVNQLEQQATGEKGLILRTFSFEPETTKNNQEEYNEATAYLFADRDGTILAPAEINRFYHNYSLTLSKKTETDALRDSQNHTTAQLEILYETPGVLPNPNPAYSPDKAIDGSTDTFWYNVCLKTNNSPDTVDINPKGWG